MLIPEPGAFYVMHRAYVDCQRLNVLHSAGAFFGTSENAVKIHIRTAVAVYVLVAIVKKRLGIQTDLYT